jgi:hypothetical protein
VISATLFQRKETEEARKRRRQRTEEAKILAKIQPCLF